MSPFTARGLALNLEHSLAKSFRCRRRGYVYYLFVSCPRELLKELNSAHRVSMKPLETFTGIVPPNVRITIYLGEPDEILNGQVWAKTLGMGRINSLAVIMGESHMSVQVVLNSIHAGVMFSEEILLYKNTRSVKTFLKPRERHDDTAVHLTFELAR